MACPPSPGRFPLGRPPPSRIRANPLGGRAPPGMMGQPICEGFPVGRPPPPRSRMNLRGRPMSQPICEEMSQPICEGPPPRRPPGRRPPPAMPIQSICEEEDEEEEEEPEPLPPPKRVPPRMCFPRMMSQPICEAIEEPIYGGPMEPFDEIGQICDEDFEDQTFYQAMDDDCDDDIGEQFWTPPRMQSPRLPQQRPRNPGRYFRNWFNDGMGCVRRAFSFNQPM
ncbi:hypothetical protein GE061_019194 [Apolygus lucorum]|uniref:Uncharacterized protein n=1 Tax=Apolygus lucorum TaxID=248454 RepID=A0A8S9X7S0_APOLU|nr:hypothetical protein GE061_019194 [Apolygus lucorum]